MSGNRKLATIAGAVVLLAGCDFVDESLIPTLTGEDPAPKTAGQQVAIPASAAESNTQPTVSGGIPQLGDTRFDPPGVTPGEVTGTAIGRRVERLRNDLIEMQQSVRVDNVDLQALRGGSISNANQYQQLVAGIQAKLQVGTTPGNPNLVRAWNGAQATLDQISSNIGQMNNLANKVANDSSLASFILESVQATFGLTGAVDADHAQLTVLEDDTNRTVVLIDRLLNELNEDISRQTNYVGRERANLTVLSLAVKNGELFGTSLANRAFASAGGVASQPAPRVGNLANRRPLVVIRFDRDDVPYQEPLFTAVSEALNRRPSAAFDLVSVVPQQGTPAQVALNANTARRNAERVLRNLTAMGLPSDRISLSATSSNETSSSEVHVYVR
ncbi:MAG: hypothetical protein GKS02_11005 [Alphaproteobacteria bacterium]|nr:hypothetical protein [Alphaproteobacteria bacterium]